MTRRSILHATRNRPRSEVMDGEATEGREKEAGRQETTDQARVEVETPQELGTKDADLSTDSGTIAVAANGCARRTGPKLTSAYRTMTGTIVGLQAARGVGTVLGEDGKQYMFRRNDVRDAWFHDLKDGDAVTFDARPFLMASDVRPSNGSA